MSKATCCQLNGRSLCLCKQVILMNIPVGHQIFIGYQLCHRLYTRDWTSFSSIGAPWAHVWTSQNASSGLSKARPGDALGPLRLYILENSSFVRCVVCQYFLWMLLLSSQGLYQSQRFSLWSTLSTFLSGSRFDVKSRNFSSSPPCQIF